jgi:hypothetical protein
MLWENEGQMAGDTEFVREMRTIEADGFSGDYCCGEELGGIRAAVWKCLVLILSCAKAWIVGTDDQVQVEEVARR